MSVLDQSATADHAQSAYPSGRQNRRPRVFLSNGQVQPDVSACVGDVTTRMKEIGHARPCLWRPAL